MKVGFYLAAPPMSVHYACARVMIASVRDTMPGVRIVQLTDRTSVPCEGVDDISRNDNGNILERRMQHYGGLYGDWLLLDTDVVVQRDVRQVFADAAFEVALADREWMLEKKHYKYAVTMPHNTGVVFQRSPRPYQHALRVWRSYSATLRASFTSEQRALYDALHTHGGLYRVLSGRVYNYPPHRVDEDVSHAAIVHYKGDRRKQWMLDRLNVCASV